MDNFDDFYETLLGVRLPGYQVMGVENAFEKGGVCQQSYEQMRKAYERICGRLGAAEEDEDLDIMVDAMETIQRELCERMYRMQAPEP